ncbi:hypothetical protein BN440_3558 [Erwinia amylovora MR1]|nr:hypothetical protein BN440_3558 [Erwinia amylovora MR1]
MFYQLLYFLTPSIYNLGFAFNFIQLLVLENKHSINLYN